MGYARPRPRRLAEKLLQIRQKLGLSQPQLAKRIDVQRYTDISKYERNILEAPLAVLLSYSRASQIPIERIIDDELDLEPAKR